MSFEYLKEKSWKQVVLQWGLILLAIVLWLFVSIWGGSAIRQAWNNSQHNACSTWGEGCPDQ